MHSLLDINSLSKWKYSLEEENINEREEDLSRCLMF